jgi:hypothetical protein
VSAVSPPPNAQDPAPPPPAPVPPPGTLPPPGTPAPLYGPPSVTTPERPATHDDLRRNLLVGAALGGGTFSYYGCGKVCGDAWMGELHVGAMLREGLALEAEVWGGFHPYSDPTFGAGRSSIGIWTLAFQIWATERLWLKTGLGVGNIEATTSKAGTALTDQRAIAFMAAIGFELARSYRYAIDLQLRYGSTLYRGVDDNPNPVAALLGFSWR